MLYYIYIYNFFCSTRAAALHLVSLGLPKRPFSAYIKGMSSLVGKDTGLDAFGRQFQPRLTAGCVCMLVAPSWRDPGRCSRAVCIAYRSAK